MRLAMADLQIAGIIVLVLSGHMLVDCRRTTKVHDALQRSSEGIAGANNHPFCNPFSSQKNKNYHFDVELSKNNCKDGACLAIELFRHKANPVLEVHGGKSWMVKDDGGTLSWSLYSKASEHNETNAAGNLKIDLLNDVESVKFYDGSKDLAPKLHIEMAPLAPSPSQPGVMGSKRSNYFELEGGLYYNERILKQGLTGGIMGYLGSSEAFKVAEKNASTQTMTRRGLNLGVTAGAVAGVGAGAALGLAMGAPGLGAWHLGSLGAVLGGAWGGGIGLALNATNTVSEVMGGYYVVRGYQIVSASSKIFAKIRCLAEFKECSTNVLVPKQKPCPGA